MKNLVLCAALIACAAPVAHAQEPLAPLPAPSVNPMNDAFVWKFAPPVGSHWQMRMFMRMKQTVETPAMGDQPAQKHEINSLSRTTMDYDVLSRDAFGATTVSVTYRDMASKTTVKNDGKTEDSPSADNLGRAVNGISYTMKVAPNGQIWNVTGLDKAINKLMMASSTFDPAERAVMRQMSQSLFSKEAVKKMMQAASGDGFPSYPIREGESWPYQVAASAGLPFQIKLDGTRTLKSLSGGIASIAESLTLDIGTMEMKMPDAGTLVMDMSGLKGNSTGTTRVQTSNGLPVESLVNQRMRGIVQTKVKDEKGAILHSAALPMDISVSVRVVMEPR